MAIATFFGLQATNPYTDTKLIQLAHPTVPHSLILAEFGEDGYQSNLQDWAKTDGRSLTGALNVNGQNFKPTYQIQASCTVVEVQLQLLEVLVLAQVSTGVPISLVDRYQKVTLLPGALSSPNWINGSPVTGSLGYLEGYAAYNVWVDLDDNYRKDQGGGWFLAQFVAKSA